MNFKNRLSSESDASTYENQATASLKSNSSQSVLVRIVGALGMLASAGCSVFGVESVEEAPYDVVRTDRQFEIRDYAPLVVAQTMVPAEVKNPGNVAFRSLFRYISGDNEASQKIAMTAPVIFDSNTNDDAESVKDTGEKIAMTAPVVSEKIENFWRYQFVLPANMTIETAPKPLNPDVSLSAIAARQVATLRYSGRATEKAQTRNAQLLLQWIEAQGLKAQSAIRWAGYNAPWTLPPFRRNEVLIDIENNNP